jgi:polyisoprenoid-binding protein YceI
MNSRQTFFAISILGSAGVCMALARPLLPTASIPTPPATISASADTYKIDPAHSTILFRIKHLGVSYVFARFNTISGSVTLDNDKPESSKVKVEIKTDSIDSGNEKRDAHLKTGDFFDVKQFPMASFTSTSVKKQGDKKFSVTGDLALHGVTKPVTVEMENVGKGKGMQGGELAGFFGTFTIKRADFGMNFMPDGLGDEVAVTVSIEADK